MPHVLAHYGLSLEQEPDSEPPAIPTEVVALFDVMFACLESALTG
jgi:hypothetical protein